MLPPNISKEANMVVKEALANMSDGKCMVVLSGGQDSTICLFWAKQHFKEVQAITFSYGQRHHIEISAARKVAQMAKVEDHIITYLDECSQASLKSPDGDYGPILESTSPLVSRRAELETYSNYETMQSIIGTRVEKTFVPMRNAFFLVMAANRAVARGINHLVTGVCEADGANYPDCREEFINSMEYTIQQALGTPFDIARPLVNVTKADSIRMALKYPGCYQALAWSHTAYDGVYPPTGKDHASVLRAHGFEEANVADPLVVRAWIEGKMELPKTPNYSMFDEAQRKQPATKLIADLERFYFVEVKHG